MYSFINTILIIIILTVVLLAMVPSKAEAFEFDPEREVGALLIALDWKQTLNIKNTPNVEEVDSDDHFLYPLGKQPERHRVNKFFIGKMILHYSYNYWLRDYPILRRTYNVVNLYTSYNAVKKNYELGLKLNF